MSRKLALLSAGGTGGHLFPAQALAQALTARGWRVHLATDPRAERFAGNFPAEETHIIESATFGGKSPIALLRTFSGLAGGYLKSRGVISKIKPNIAVGFGGYPTVPPLLAAAHKGLPTVLHEQNAVMGRANRFLASRVSVIATGFDLVGEAGSNSAPVVTTGNPLRAVVHEAAKVPYQVPRADGPFHLLVFGGSQGARFFAEAVPKALENLDRTLLDRLNLTLQARPEDAETARAALSSLKVKAEVQSFFDDLPHRIAQSHFVVSRSGASTVSEIACIGRPALLVPYPGALDDDQGKNAAHLEALGGAKLVRQKDLGPDKLAQMLKAAMEDPQMLANQAENAKKAGVSDAEQRLADLVEAHV